MTRPPLLIGFPVIDVAKEKFTGERWDEIGCLEIHSLKVSELFSNSPSFVGIANSKVLGLQFHCCPFILKTQW